MAEETGERSKLPFGASPGLLAIGGVALVALGAYALYPMLQGQKPAPTAAVANAAAPAIVTQAAQAPAGPAKAEAPPPEDPLATFLVRFGRTNPFAPLSGVAPSRQTGTPPSQTEGSRLRDLQDRVRNMQEGVNGTGTATGNTGPGGASMLDDGFTLTGIVRLEHLALAVIRRGDKAFIVGPGDPLEKTGYTLKKIEGDKVTLASSHKELVLVLRGKKP